MDWLKKAPTAVAVAMIIMCGVIALGVLAAFVILTLSGEDTSDFRMWINTVGQIVVFPLLGITVVGTAAAAKSAGQAADQTNGHLTEKDAEIERLRAHIASLRKLR